MLLNYTKLVRRHSLVHTLKCTCKSKSLKLNANMLLLRQVDIAGKWEVVPDLILLEYVHYLSTSILTVYIIMYTSLNTVDTIV